jgi:hypothetical protein
MLSYVHMGRRSHSVLCLCVRVGFLYIMNSNVAILWRVVRSKKVMELYFNSEFLFVLYLLNTSIVSSIFVLSLL